MAATRKFNYSWKDENGNIHLSNTDPGPSNVSKQISNDVEKNVINSMVPSADLPAGTNQTASANVTAGVISDTPGTPAYRTGNFTPSARLASYRDTLAGVESTPRPTYSMSSRVRDYQDRLADYEDADKPTWQSKYEPAIQSILDGILNRKSFDLNSDANYQNLYNQYSQQYMAQGNRAMRDQLGASAALTGGYGSTAAQAAASQAYDNYMQQLNDRNLQLAQMAYGMYQDENADRYNQLGAVTNLDNTDYGRYRDEVSDFYTDRDYWANRYQQEYANDYGQYRDDVSDYFNDRDYWAGRYQNEYANDFGEYSDDYNRYSDAVNIALQYAQKGLPVPSYIAKQIQDYTGAADISDVIAAMPVTTGGSGGSGGGRGRSGGSKSKSKTDTVYKSGGWMPYSDELSKSQRYENEVISKAEKMSSAYDKYKYIEDLAETNKLTWVQAYAILQRLGVDVDYFATFEENMRTDPERTKQAFTDQNNKKLKKSTFLNTASLKW